MKKKMALFMIAGVLLLPGCGNIADTDSGKTGGGTGQTVTTQERETEAADRETTPEKPNEGDAESAPEKPDEGNAESAPEKPNEEDAESAPEKPNEGDAESAPEKPDEGNTENAPKETSEGSIESAPEKTDGNSKEKPVEGSEGREAEDGQYTWQDITVALPEDWDGRCIIVENENGFSIFQKASYETDNTLGYICGFWRTREPLESGSGETLIACAEDGTLYYLVQPMDVACDTENEEIAGEYLRMCQQVPQIQAAVQNAALRVQNNAEEFVLPASSILELDQEALAGLSDNELWIARNEIYARHGRLFNNEYLQQYFNRCAWYEGEIPAEEFRESALSQLEKDNLKLLAAAELAYEGEHPYPKRCQAAETVTEELSGDGMADQISYQVTEQENGEYQCRITVNGETFIANELSYAESEGGMTNPTMDCFYITDIVEDDGILEIAVLDEGPSDDPVTYFFRYDGTLSCIGWVPGFPFAEMNEGVNGFNGAGGITGHSRIDLIETAYLYDYWWFDGRRITYVDMSWFDLLPYYEHTLYEDLPVHCDWDETSATTIIPAQEEVYFLGTDGKQWILVKGKDGSQGYMLVEDGNIVALNKSADQVFSGLQFSG